MYNCHKKNLTEHNQNRLSRKLVNDTHLMLWFHLKCVVFNRYIWYKRFLLVFYSSHVYVIKIYSPVKI